jgi:DNA (cytosine-5)-methyltransferase 1
MTGDGMSVGNRSNMRTRSRPKLGDFSFVDLFAGIGGARLGLEWAGGNCVFSSEWNTFAVRTYRENFGEDPKGDIRSIRSSEIPRHDLLSAGFPCQPFSIAGVSKKRSLDKPTGFEDPNQGTLFFEIVRVLREKRPKAFLLENVKNLLHYEHGATFATILASLEEAGYTTTYRVVDASAIVPQHRERVFIAGLRRDLQIEQFEIPEPRGSHPKVAQILEENPDPKYTLTDHLWSYLQRYAEKHRKAGNGFGYGIAPLDGISRTLSARYFKDGAEILIAQNGRSPRRLTPRECARLMGFPDSFRIPVSDTQAYKQFGNAVVPGVVAEIGRRMNECLCPVPRSSTLASPA